MGCVQRAAAGIVGKGVNGLSESEANQCCRDLMINILNYIHTSLNLEGLLYLQGLITHPISFSDHYISLEVY